MILNKKQFILIIFLLIIKVFLAQEPNNKDRSLSSPYQTIYTHLYNLQDETYHVEKSAETIFGNYSLSEKEDLVIKIKKVLDGKALYINMDQVPRDNNYIDSLSRKNIYYLSPKEKKIFLEKKNGLWYYSQTTIQEINALYNEVYPFWARFIEDKIANKSTNKSIFGIKFWQFLSIFLLVIFSFMIYFLIKNISLFFIRNILLKSFGSKIPHQNLLFKISKAISLILTFLFLSKAFPTIQLPLLFSVRIILVINILLILFTAYLVNNIVKFLFYYAEIAADKTETKLDNQLLPVLKKMLKIIIYFIAIIYVLQELEVNITALLAGLSVGGLALALASKDTVQNFIGSLNIFLDRPFEIGDYIILGDIDGTIEEVGLRATRIRTPNQSLAYIPNGKLSNMTIDNYGLRIYRRWKTSFGLDYNTTPEKIEFFIASVKTIINKNEHTLNDKTMVYFNNLGASTLDIYVSVFFDVKSLEDDLRCKQAILLEVLKMTNKNKIEFAFPSQTIYRK